MLSNLGLAKKCKTYHVAVVVEVQVVLQYLLHVDLVDAERQVQEKAHESGPGNHVQLVLVVVEEALSHVELELGGLPKDVR